MSEPLDAREARSFEGGASFGLSHRLYRAIWSIAWLFLASWTHPLHGWRRTLLRAFGAKVGRGVYVAPSARIWFPKNLELDDFVAIGDNVDIYNMALVKIGKYGIVSKGAHLCGGTHDIDDKYFQLQTKPIYIGAYAWVAAEAFVGPGVSIDEGAVLGARGLAVRNLSAWTVYVGSPAKPIRKRTPYSRSDAPKRGWRKSLEKQK